MAIRVRSSKLPPPKRVIDVSDSQSIRAEAITWQSWLKNRPYADIGIADEQDEERINALIDQYQKQIKAAQSAGIYTPPAPETGALFSLSV